MLSTHWKQCMVLLTKKHGQEVTPSTGAQFPCTIFTTKAGHSIRCHARSGNPSYGVIRVRAGEEGRVIASRDWFGAGWRWLYRVYAIVPRPYKCYGASKFHRLVKPLDHLPRNGVFYPVYCVLRLLSYLWDALWSLSWSGISPFILDSK